MMKALLVWVVIVGAWLAPGVWLVHRGHDMIGLAFCAVAAFLTFTLRVRT